MNARCQPTWAWYAYRCAAQVSAWILATPGVADSVLARRSLGTGEMTFARSDTDLFVVLAADRSTGEDLLRLYGALGWAKIFNPTLNHVEVFAPKEIERFAQLDTAWAAQEENSTWSLVGSDCNFPQIQVYSEDGLRRFILWCELYLGAVVARRSPRNLRKIALECWNYFAVAEGLLPAPLTRREEMATHLTEMRGPQVLNSLSYPQACATFVLALANELHSTRLPTLKTLHEPQVLKNLVAPHGMVRELLLWPKPDCPLPSKLPPWTFLATPELLNLYLHFKNAYFSWDLTKELRSLGVQDPGLRGFVRDGRYYLSPQFLRVPGFTDQRSHHPENRLDCVAYALPYLESGQLPPPRSWEPRPQLSGRGAVTQYFRQDYDRILSRQQELDTALERVKSQGLD